MFFNPNRTQFLYIPIAPAQSLYSPQVRENHALQYEESFSGPFAILVFDRSLSSKYGFPVATQDSNPQPQTARRKPNDSGTFGTLVSLVIRVAVLELEIKNHIICCYTHILHSIAIQFQKK